MLQTDRSPHYWKQLSFAARCLGGDTACSRSQHCKQPLFIDDDRQLVEFSLSFSRASLGLVKSDSSSW